MSPQFCNDKEHLTLGCLGHFLGFGRLGGLRSGSRFQLQLIALCETWLWAKPYYGCLMFSYKGNPTVANPEGQHGKGDWLIVCHCQQGFLGS